MNKYIYLLKNIGLLTLSNFATRLLSFFLVPLYTSVLTTGQYGTYDLFNTTISLLIPIFTLNALEFVLRFSLDNDCSRKAIVTVACKWLIISNIASIAILLINNFFSLNYLLTKYGLYFVLMFFTQTLSGLVTAYVRGTDHVAALSVSSVIASIFTIICNILFLIPFHWGLAGYFLANIIGPLIQCLYLIIVMRIWRNIDFKIKYNAQEREMLHYSIPMIANSISWWVNSASDRYVVIWFCGIAANGIYSVSNKIPSILNVFQTIFGQAWALSAVKDFDPNDKSGFFINTYNAYNCLMVIVCSIIIATDRLLSKYLYIGKFYSAWKYVPFLTIAIVFGALVGYIGGFFTAVKDSKIFAISTVVGAVTNIILNLILVPFIGALGSALATTVSCIEVWIVRLIQSKKYIKLRINLIRDCSSYILLFVQTIVLLFMSENIVMYAIQGVLIILNIMLYKSDIGLFLSKILKNN